MKATLAFNGLSKFKRIFLFSGRIETDNSLNDALYLFSKNLAKKILFYENKVIEKCVSKSLRVLKKFRTNQDLLS